MNRATTYSLSWAWNVYQAWLQTWGRATDIWKEITEFDDCDIVLWISRDQRRWNKFKQEVKWLQKHVICDTGRLDETTIQMLRWKIARFVETSWEWPMDGLTTTLVRSTLGEHGS